MNEAQARELALIFCEATSGLWPQGKYEPLHQTWAFEAPQDKGSNCLRTCVVNEKNQTAEMKQSKACEGGKL